MEIRGIPADRFADVVGKVSAGSYGGNVELAYTPVQLNQRGDRFRARLRVVQSRGAGGRRSRSGRRMPVACWHTYRDVLAECFRLYPDATVRTGLAVYRGAAGFEAVYPATGDVNMGGVFDPVCLADMCDCDND